MADANSTHGLGPHGHKNPLFLGYYGRGCRCSECKTASQNYRRSWIARRLAADPDYARRIQARYKATEYGKKQTAKYYSDRCDDSEWMAERARKSRKLIAARRELLAKIKVDRGCADCGYNAHATALDFDHVTGEKFAEVSVMGTLSLDRIMAEVAKCEVVCYRCHRIRTTEQMRSGGWLWARKKIANPSTDTRKIARYRARGAALLADVKLQSGCADCGYRGRSEALDFDHVRGIKKFNISQRLQYKPERLLAEIAKCDVVCANCHRIRTYNRRREQPSSG